MVAELLKIEKLCSCCQKLCVALILNRMTTKSVDIMGLFAAPRGAGVYHWKLYRLADLPVSSISVLLTCHLNLPVPILLRL